MMAAIIAEAEANAASWGHYETFPEDLARDDAVSITRAARELAQDRDVSNVAVFTETGNTALLMSKARPDVPILAFTPEITTYRRLGILWGVVPFLVPYASTVEAMLGHAEAAIASATDLKAGEQIVFISGFPVGAHRLPNFALLHTIGEIS
jgi:pyruvate kinase